MLKNHFKIAWRNLRRNRVFSAINILGLPTGPGACLLIVAVGPGMAAAFPGVEASTRLHRIGDNFVRYGNRQFNEQQIACVDSQFLRGLHRGCR